MRNVSGNFMTNPKTKLLIAKEYLFFLKSIAISALLFLAITVTIWTINQYRKSLIQNKDSIVSQIDSLEKMKGSQSSFENSQLTLYNSLHTPQYYTKTFSEFKIQFKEDSSRQKLYSKMVESQLFKGQFDAFKNEYFPLVDKKIVDNIIILKQQESLFNKKSLTLIPFISWQIGIIAWIFIFYVLRFFIYSLKKSILIVRQHKKDN